MENRALSNLNGPNLERRGDSLLLCFQYKEGLPGIILLFCCVFIPNTNSSSFPRTANLHVPGETDVCHSPVRKVRGGKERVWEKPSRSAAAGALGSPPRAERLREPRAQHPQRFKI